MAGYEKRGAEAVMTFLRHQTGLGTWGETANSLAHTFCNMAENTEDQMQKDFLRRLAVEVSPTFVPPASPLHTYDPERTPTGISK